MNLQFFFDNPANYNFDSTLIEIVVGVEKLKAQIIGAQAYMYVKLDENKGLVAIDSSGNNRHGAFQGGFDENIWTTGKINSAIEGIGTNGYINFDSIASFERTDAFSLECWCNFSSSLTQAFLSKQINAGNFQGYAINVVSGIIRGVIRDDVGNIITVASSLTYSDNLWHHIVLTYDGSSLAAGVKLYVDNVDVTTLIDTDTLTGSLISTANFQISGRNGNNIVIAAGTKLDECLLYARELTPAEVAARWNNGNGTQQIPGATTSFPITNPLSLLAADFSASEFLAFDATITEPGNDTIGWIIVIDGVDKYWNGSNWDNSSGFLQSNTLAEIKTYITNLVLIGKQSINIGRYYHSDDGSTTPETDFMEIEYNSSVDTVGPSLTKVVGESFNPDGTPSTDIITIIPSEGALEYGNDNQINKNAIYVTPNSLGKWSVFLIDNEGTKEDSFYTWKWTRKTEYKKVPRTDEIEYNNLTAVDPFA